MKPYYEDEAVTLVKGDMFFVDLPAADVAIVDPPYGETSLEWDRWPKGWPSLLVDVVPTFWCFGSFRMFMEHRDEFDGWKIAQEIVWEKHNGSGFHADRFKRVHELAVQFYRGVWGSLYKDVPTTPTATARTMRRKARPPHTGDIGAAVYTSEDGGPRLVRSVIYVQSCQGFAVHPTQKPTGILEPLIHYSCPPGGLVLDPFAGSGSTLVAARAIGRRAHGVEINEGYCAAAVARLSQGALDFGAAS